MTDIFGFLEKIHRPKLLIRAARIGANDYRREAHLAPYFGYGALPKTAAAIVTLIDIERTMNDKRHQKDAQYTIAKHVNVLIAVMGEARLLRASRPKTTEPVEP